MQASKKTLVAVPVGLAMMVWLGLPGWARAQQEQQEQQEQDEAPQEQEADEGEDQDPQEEPEPPESFAETIVVTGTRAEGRSVVESMVPIDVIPVEELIQQGDTDVSNLLRNLTPSYNVNTQPISDAATLVRPANLRGLAPDHTLVLVNNKRRHRAAVISWIGNGVADGAQGPDISTIPAIALRQAEVLRDGASAQYGSDAIAGVLNFILKDSVGSGTVEIRGGEFAEGDGQTGTVAGNFGFGLGADGFLNLTAELGQSDPTSRSVQRDDAAALIRAGNTAVRDPAQIWGNPEIDDDVKLFANFGSQVGASNQFYGHANYASKSVTGGFFYRNPNTRDAVFSNDGGDTLLIGDLIDAQDGILDGSAGCPIVRIVDDVPDPVALQQVFNDPNCFSFQELFPGGFTPQFGGDVEDGSLLLGLRGQVGDLGWDASASYGTNEVDFFISNTVNASLGPATPTEFDPGLYAQDELNLNFDVTYPIGDSTNLAGGVEWRDEEFEIGIGQLESYDIGPLAAQGFSAASNGFPGFGDIAAGTWSRSNWAVYGDLERAGSAGRWSFGVAARFEDYEDFGTTTNGKLSGRFAVTEQFQLRGAVSTGFRAPTPGQSNAFNVTTEFDLVQMELVNNGTIPSISRVAQLRGGEPLEPEESENYSLGAVYQKGGFLLTADFFRVDVSDRLALSQLFTLTPDEVDDLIAEGITSAGNLENFRFFVNDFDTQTDGFDLVATWTPRALDGDTSFSLLFNNTDTEVTRFNPDTVDAIRIRELEEGLPDTRVNLSWDQRVGDRWRFLVRSSYWAGWFDSEDGVAYSGETLCDVEGAYSLANGLTFVLGVQNLFDTTPDENAGARSGVGNLYSQFTPFGFNGAFYYARVKYDFDI
ncbi:MAG TPA: TonB-dependent receptor [Thermoanaerobaculia bacterium]|nr:TonB-dependent receptor [Thermoanaerobaculia bacterium]